MSLVKKVSAAALAAAMAFSLSSCGKEASWGANINGKEYRAGLLIYEQTMALPEAYIYMTEQDTDVLNITIEGKTSKEWINDKAVENIRKYAAVEDKFDELGLSLTDAELKRVSNTTDQWWSYLSGNYEKLGVGRQTYYDIVLNAQKKDKIFDYYYAEGGVLAVTDDEIKTYLEENNARIKFFEIPLKDGEGNLLKSAGKEEMKTRAEGYIERIKGGESFEAVKADYEKYYSDLIAAAQGTAPEADENNSEEESTVLISKNSSYPTEKTVETVFGGLVNGDCVLVEENESYYIVSKIDLFSDETFFENEKDDALYDMKIGELDAEIEKWVQSQQVVVNEAAIRKYKLEKLTKE